MSLNADGKVFALFGVVSLLVFFIGTGGLSLQEAESRVEETLKTLGPEQVKELRAAQAGFTESAIYWCMKSVNDIPREFSIIMEMTPDGHVKRLWRKGDTRFANCLQAVAKESFVFRPYFQPFFVSLDYRYQSGRPGSNGDPGEVRAQ